MMIIRTRSALNLIVALIALVVTTAAAVASALPTTAGNDQGVQYAADRIIVSFDPSVSVESEARGVQVSVPTPLSQLNAKYGVKSMQPAFPGVGAGAGVMSSEASEQAEQLANTYIIAIPAGVDPVDVAAEYANLPGVRYAEPDYIRHAQRVDPNDVYWSTSNSWGQGYRDQWDMELMACPAAWDVQTGSASVVIAVSDTGVDYNHADMAANMWHNPGEIPSNGVDDDGNGKIDDYYGYDFVNNDANPMDDNGHGSHCAGTIGAVGNNSVGIAGVNWKCSVMAVKGLSAGGSGYDTGLAAGIIYAADEGADVISMSWGGSGGSETMRSALAYAHDVRNCVLVVAGGNSNADIAGYSPAMYNYVMTVAASDQLDAKCSFSNWGIKTAVAAPGGGPSYSTPPYAQYNCLSLRAGTTNLVSSDCIVGTNYYRLAGTSMACPHVAGLAGLVLAEHPTWTNEQVRQAIQMGADDILTAGFDRYSGFGRINAYKAVTSPEPLIAFISSPANATSQTGVVDVKGTAGGPNFASYTLDCGAGQEPTTWTTIATSSSPVTNGSLASWDSASVGSGVHTLRLRTMDAGGTQTAEFRIAVTLVSPYGSKHYTELFSTSSPFDLDNMSLVFVPDGSAAFYSVYRQQITGLPTDPAGGTPLSLSDNSSAQVDLTGGAQVSIYGSARSTFYVGSNGYVTFDSGDSTSLESFTQHFALKRISALFDDLVPAAGSVTWKQLADRAVVTFENVPEFGTSNQNTFQIEMLFNGTIVLSYLDIAAVDGLAGLSAGLGTPSGFSQSNLSACGPLVVLPRMLAMIRPNGGEQYEPGTDVPIQWTSAGAKWVSTDTVRLEYSANAGTSWNPIPGAASLAYNLGSYEWDTTGLPEGNLYRVRAVFNDDAAVNDASNGNFAILIDTVPPAITHTPLGDTGNTSGPYSVRATVTDKVGVSSVTLYYSKNGAAFSSTAMTPSGTANEYAAGIPGPSVVGDSYNYYITASDAALTPNSSRAPLSGDYSFDVIDQLEVLSYIQYSDNSATGEYQNTLKAIRATYPVNSTELTNYTQLETAIVGKDVLLVPEQENGSLAQMQTIGTAWKTTLESFLAKGGRIVVCDWSGGSYGILTGSGLMAISGQTNITSQNVQVSDPSSPIAAGVTSPYNAANGSNSYSTTEGGVVVRSSTGAPVVIAKPVTAGYVILVGHDYYSSNTVQDRVVANAVGSQFARTLVIAKPSGGEFYEPGQIVPIQWSAGGSKWLSTDTVRLECSPDAGATWSAIPGAASLAYNAGSYSWDTTGLPESSQYRVRVTFNDDASVSASSDADFSIATDKVPPMIAHTPLVDSGSTTGPYTVRATVTDITGVASVTLYYSKNGAAFSSVSMSESGTPNEYVGSIPGPSVVGDSYHYYITATDAAKKPNSSRSPATGDYSFGIIDQIEVLSYIQYSDNTSTGEYQNTLKAIRATYPIGNTELTNYTLLETALVGKDVLLVPEQEIGTLTQMQTIGAAWKTTLEGFLARGGRVVVCDWSGGAYGILTGAGLMSISSAKDITGQNVQVTDGASPIAVGVASPYAALSGSNSYSTTETGVVVRTSSGEPVVIAKPISAGLVVLLGHDYFSSNASEDRLVANAVGSTFSRALAVTRPNGGEQYEPGQMIAIQWVSGGPDWQPADRVRLEYSSNGGTSWNRISGAANLPYSLGSYSWNTTGLPESGRYRVRVALNDDDDRSLTDASDADFAIMTDTVPPVITHTPLSNTGNTTGPYSVRATVTDASGISSAILRYSKNGGAFAEVAMAPSGTANEYLGNIPGPSVVGDNYHYYITATDAARSPNASRAPATGDYSFTVIDQIDILSFTQFSDNSTTGEYQNTLKAIRATYPISSTELTDYTKLETAIVGMDVLLVPEQENGSLSQMQTIGATWKATLDSFLARGGRIVVCDFTGGSYGLLTGAGLMSISGQTGVTDQTVQVSDPSSPIVAGVTTPYKAANGSDSYTTTESGAVVRTSTGAPVVIAKPVSAGYVILIGHDYYASNASQDRLVANAVGCSFSRALGITQPNGGEHYEPGQSVSIRWAASGPDWLPADTVRLEYSSNAGTSWNPIPGAAALAYNAGSFSWDTAGLAPSTGYRARVIFNDDLSVTDASDANFTIAADTVAPAIVHTPLADTSDVNGPYSVRATVTDNLGVADVTLYYSKNGGAFSSVAMTPSGAANEYAGAIPGPSVVGDIYHYYITARDTAGTPNSSRAPASGDYSFAVTSDVTDTIGDTSTYTSASNYLRGNAFSCTTTTTLRQIEHYLSPSASTELRFFVYESTSLSGTYTKIHETVAPGSGTGLRWYGSGPISVPLIAGRYYIIGTAWQGNCTYYYTSSAWHPRTVAFGRSECGYAKNGVYPPPDSTTSTSSSAAYHQRLTTSLVGRILTVAKPNGGERYEPGQAIRVEWTGIGPKWLPADKVKLEYSANQGTSWNPIPGAADLAYNAGSYSWDTTGVADSSLYRVRVAFTTDPSVNDSSDANFTIAADTVPPVITHTPLAGTGDTTGPYVVRATVTDGSGLSNVTLHYSKNGGAITDATMTPSGTANEYVGNIPGPSVVGDTYNYYITATDAARTPNTSRAPATGDYSFAISDSLSVLSYIQYSDNSSTGEYQNTLKAIRATYTINNTALSDYTQLATAIVGKDVLLIPEQELGNLSQLQTVGTAWKTILETFLARGGRIVVCDFTGGSYGVLTGAGLMSITGQTGITGQTVQVTDLTSPFVAGVTSPYSAANGSDSYTTTETGVLVRTAGGAPVVIAKPVSAGYVILIGHDYYESNASVSRLVANAVGAPLSRYLSITKPNGGEHYEPGQSVVITWTAGGPKWLPTDTVKLEYSGDNGARWNLIPGAVGLAYDAGSYTWDTTGLPGSSQYKVRVVVNHDPSISDTSDAAFTVDVHTTPPVIAHTGLPDAAAPGPYYIRATVTDDLGVSGVTLHYSKNSGPFTSVPMTASGAPNEYIRPITDPSVVGDSYQYYITATDGARTPNSSRAPVSGEYYFKVVATVTDTVGSAATRATVSAYSQGNVFSCASTTTLDQIEQYLEIAVSTELRFVVYESTTLNGTYSKIREAIVPSSGTGMRWYSSGPVSVPLVAGRYYIITTATQGQAYTYYALSGHPKSVAFGRSEAGYAASGYPPAGSATHSNWSYVFYQRLTTAVVGRSLEIASPDGGEQYEPGDIVPIQWTAAGSQWLPADTVKLEYSSNGGANWNPIPGAASLAYNSGSYSWDAACVASSSQYRVRVAYTADPSVSDASDANFSVMADVVPPVITHTPLTDTSDTGGPYTVRAAVTDNLGVSSVTLHYSKNGEAFASADMTPSGTTNEYTADIPGPSLIGDNYRYYITATDTARTPNASRAPAAGNYSFDIVDALQVLSYIQYSDTSATGEYQNTLKAVRANHLIANTELTDYTQLATAIAGKDVLLIPEQEMGSLYQMQAVGTAWKATLESFLAEGGRIVVCDYTGGSYGVLTAAGLMSISSQANITFQNVQVSDPGSPIAAGVASPYVAASGSTSYTTTETDVVVRSTTGAAVAIAKRVSAGYVILLGHDYSSSNASMDRLVANAVGAPFARSLTITCPNGGEQYEPGTTVSIEWDAAGSKWLHTDAVSLNYSSDDGASWAPIPGAESLAYNSGSYSWDTTGLGVSSQYRVRVAYNDDPSLNDASDAGFTIMTDTTPPVIAHTPLADTSSATGPYTVRATVTDNVGVSSVTLYYSKNAEPFSSVAMLPSGTANGYAGAIPGPSVVGDIYHYYITATDAASTPSTTRAPASGDYSFTVKTGVADTVGSTAFSSSAAGYSRGNVFACSATTALNELEIYLNPSTSTELRFFVYESTLIGGTYNKIHETVVPSSGTGEGWYSSGAISVPLVAGRYYIMGTAWQGIATYYYASSGHPKTTAFGKSQNGYYATSYPPASTTTNPLSTTVYYQRLTTSASAGTVIGLADLKASEGTGEVITLSNSAVVTYAPRDAANLRTTNYFYVGEARGLGCVRVVDMRGDDLMVGKTVAGLTGRVTKSDVTGEYTLTLITDPVGYGADAMLPLTAITPLGLSNKAALNDTAILTNPVRIWGRVRNIDEDGTSFTISDGYGTNIAVVTNGVPLPALFDATKLVIVNGILTKDGSGSRVVYAQDITSEP